MSVKNLRIGTRLGAAFAAITLLIAVVAGTSAYGLNEIDRELEEVVHDRYAKVHLVHQINAEVNLQARALRNLLIMETDDQRANEFKRIDASHQKAGEMYKSLDLKVKDAQARPLLDKLMEQRRAFLVEQEALVQAVRSGDLAAAKSALIERVEPRQLQYQQAAEDLAGLQERMMEETAQSADVQVTHTEEASLSAAVLAIALAVATGLLVTRSVTVPLSGAVRSLRSVADGDLTVDVTIDRGDEVGDLQAALSDTVAALGRVVAQVRTGVDCLTTASTQIAVGNQDLSSRTEEQASSLQETASSMEEITGSVRQSADSARAASELASQARSAAGRGGEIVDQVVGTMDDITAHSRKISDIIGVIDGIAFQTNILALNAAVEAARAGEEGRGFAVVAGEVRLLAHRSAEAAKEIKRLIGTSVDRVEAGSRQVNEAGEAMRSMVEQVRKVSDLIGEIAGSAEEQSRGIEQVNIAVAQMDQVTQQNAALVEESAAATASLAHQAQELSNVVSIFRLRPSADAPAAVAPRGRAALVAPRPLASPVSRQEPRTAPRPAARTLQVASGAPVTALADDAWESF
ncbi:methyl-accepting chemotaxis protein [Ideonella sp. DXS29W]|uniref:Methyl-accepting chemotaxis protein n=1 Tax=Ideonella lacteola TaxID=2984193 RepID=A0ABU9C1T4_9BURK